MKKIHLPHVELFVKVELEPLLDQTEGFSVVLVVQEVSGEILRTLIFRFKIQ